MKTSFGELEILLKAGSAPMVEYLKFSKNGRPHQHEEFESFFTTKGSGVVVVGETRHAVKPGSLVVIAPNEPHWMEPSPNETLEGLLWYHKEKLNLV